MQHANSVLSVAILVPMLVDGALYGGKKHPTTACHVQLVFICLYTILLYFLFSFTLSQLSRLVYVEGRNNVSDDRIIVEEPEIKSI